MDIATFDQVDRKLVHALQIDGRVPFNKIAGVLGTSDSTVARRYRRLRTAGLLRVVGSVNLARLGYTAWTIRLQCTPDVSEAIATALARRNDTFWVHLLSGGTEVICSTQARFQGDEDTLLLQRLSRTNRVVSVTAHSMLQGFASPRGWSGLVALTAEQAEVIRPEPVDQDEGSVTLSEEDHALLEVLSQDGRAGYGELADATGWSESTVKRRLMLLRRTGILSYEVDLPVSALGYHAEARLWMSVQPSALASVARSLAEHPEISFAAVTTGPTNLMASVICRDARDLYRYLTERIGALDAVRSLETATVDRTVKRAGSIQPSAVRPTSSYWSAARGRPTTGRPSNVAASTTRGGPPSSG
ncbi:DNA-binding Lrp family transcriptional regulator [Nocardiopsis mwathae]|uniref:DNA-binding Lrp family transcriptional regulator n=1 Tax=Nocardiopsis mwathae TaxID=1472723 RepID=A0A7W9YLA1_9ACTN|nr:Lrp/AsnC family transcriptional regulator [Nocardiopsis mwathae]MBB6174253.1 DNA-binding Lrp family transcriptional regulator [Nocardiopsis mwathae]